VGVTQSVKRPAFQWYPGDHRRDTALQACAFEARALWREMLDLMHDGEPYGHLTAGGDPIDVESLARIIGKTRRDVSTWLAELERKKVFSRTDTGVIYSRRMVRDEHTRAVRAEAGSKGGNPVLLGTKDKPPNKPEVNQRGYPKPKQRAEQNPTPAVASASAVASALQKPPGASTAASGESAAPPSPAAPGVGRRPNWVTELGEDWKRIRRGSPPYGQIGAELKTLHAEHGIEVLRAAWVRFLESPKAQFGVPFFARNLGDFLEPPMAVASPNGTHPHRSTGAEVAATSEAVARHVIARTGGKVT
jgi:hypothetical protein